MKALARRGVPEARTLMRVLACYAPGRWVIPLDMLTPQRLAASGLPVSAPGADAERAWQRALDGLVEIGLVSVKVTAGEQVRGVVLQRLVAEVARASDTPDVDRVEAAAVRCCCWSATAWTPADRPTGPRCAGWSRTSTPCWTTCARPGRTCGRAR